MPAPIYTQITQQLAARQIERRRSVRRTAAKRLSGSSVWQNEMLLPLFTYFSSIRQNAIF